MMSIAYVSEATAPMSEQGIVSLLKRARANNDVRQRTGALLYHEGRFVQILEGPDEAVEECFEAICADPRHRSIQKISEEQIEQRRFAEWTMAFRPSSPEVTAHLRGWDDFFSGRRGDARLRYAGNPSQQLLEWLTDYWFTPSALR
ncbi:hypothetical protein ATY41_12050 [Leifsonia xyli subsp. xyli]|uniref:Photopigment and puc expression activator n=2 Tax=Leifsonia xyli subsp. xyli TaxID=59736 RepID=Q6AGS2_LEIXX|nr:BLUF domain-containing protein [Leifsonia xyli]AAT88423.1 photopigment and puc expression activator [Leifsonia xyli subsp. xyli str. CTCB07]ODA89869.1 hypothetical protein ATY41_12050 [Leifsonia xyli subsp. xyli]